jgi:metal-sulfur cluster biosynthetic enzyme
LLKSLADLIVFNHFEPMDTAAPEPLTLERVYAALKNCYDPEMPVNIVDLGLVYDVQIEEENQVMVKMTLTTPGCSMGGMIAKDAETKIRAIPEVKDVKVDIVWDPPWTQHMISEAGRKKLGMT